MRLLSYMGACFVDVRLVPLGGRTLDWEAGPWPPGHVARREAFLGTPCVHWEAQPSAPTGGFALVQDLLAACAKEFRDCVQT